MCTVTGLASAGEALDMLESLSAVLARADLAQVPDEVVARGLRVLERADAVQAAVRGRLLAVFDARDLHLADGQRSTRSWLVHSLGVTRGQAAEHKAVQALARDHGPLLAGLAGGHVRAKSVALQLAKWTRRSRRSSGRRLRRSWWPRPGPGPGCGSWPRSARRSASGKIAS